MSAPLRRRTLALVPVAVFLGVCAAPPASAQAPDGSDAPTGLERLRDPQEPGKLRLGAPDAPSGETPEGPPEGTKKLGGDAPNSPDAYTPGRPQGDRSSDPKTIGGGTRVEKGGSPLDDIR